MTNPKPPPLVIAFFRNNQFSTVIFLAAYLGLLRLPALLGFVPAPEKIMAGGGVVCDWFLKFIAPYPFFSALLAGALVLLQAVLLNNTYDIFRISPDRTWVPGMMYTLLASCIPAFQHLSPPLMATTFVVLSLRPLFGTYKQANANSQIFDTAFWLTAGSLFYPPTIFLQIAALVGAGVLRSFNFRERVVFLTGVIVPIFFVWLWFFWKDEGGWFWQQQIGSLATFYKFDTEWDLRALAQALFLGILFLVILLGVGNYYHKKLIQVQKYVNILFWYFFVGLAILLLRDKPEATYFILLMPPAAIFMAMNFLKLRNQSLAEVFHLILVGTVFFLQLFPF